MDERFTSKLPDWLTLDKLKYFFIILILLWMASRLASLFWVGVGSFLLKGSTTGLSTSSIQFRGADNTPKVLLSDLKKTSLFGKGPTDVKGEVSKVKNKEKVAVGEISDDAPATRLPITLTGLISGGDSRLSTAIIKHQENESSYHLNDALPPNDQATLVRVLFDRIIIRNAGRYESLALFDTKDKSETRVKTEQSTVSKKSESIQSSGSSFGSESEKRRDAITKIKDMVTSGDGQALSKVFNVTVAQGEGGKIKGYKVFPGKDKQIFEDLGLKRGDIITSVNGMDLSDPQKAAGMMASLSEGGDMTFTIEQDGVLKDISLNL